MKPVSSLRGRICPELFQTGPRQGCKARCHRNTTESAHSVICFIMKNRPVPLQIQRELVDEHKNSSKLRWGRQSIRASPSRSNAVKLKAVQMLRELKGKDETREEPVAETCKIQEVNKMRMDSGGTTADYSEEKWRR